MKAHGQPARITESPNHDRSKPQEGALELANQTGKRYVCAKCNAEFIVTKGGNGDLGCCGQPMQLK